MLDAGELAKLVFYNDIVVGGVCCRVDASPVGRKVRPVFHWLSISITNIFFSSIS